jgi:hypothetical protein
MDIGSGMACNSQPMPAELLCSLELSHLCKHLHSNRCPSEGWCTAAVAAGDLDHATPLQHHKQMFVADFLANSVAMVSCTSLAGVFLSWLPRGQMGTTAALEFDHCQDSLMSMFVGNLATVVIIP